MIRASDFNWTIVDDDGAETALDPSDIYDYRFRWGGYQNRRSAPESFSPSGSLILNREINQSVLEGYSGLKIQAGGETYKDLIIADFEVERRSDQTKLLLQSRGAADGQKEIEWGLRPTPDSPAVTVPEFSIPGVTLVTEPLAPLPLIACVSPPDPERDFYNTTLRRIIGGVESLGHVLLVEDVSLPSPTWRALPLPLRAEADHRPVGTTFGGFTHLIELNRFKRGVARHWAADRYNANVGGSPFDLETISFDRLVVNDVYDPDYSYYLGRPRSSSSRAEVWVSNVSTRFAGFSDFPFVSPESPFPPTFTYVAPDGSYAGIVVEHDASVRVTGQLRYYDWRDSYNESETVYRANGKAQAEKRTLGNRFFTVYREDANPARLQDLIDAWDEWRPTYATMQFVVEDLSTHSAASYKPGDRIGLDVADLSHHAVIIGAEWRMRGNRPLRVRWDIVTQQELPDAAVYLHNQTNLVNLPASKPVYLEV